MKAVFQTRYGSPDHLEVREVDRPRIDDNEVLVRVRAASVHPDVWHVVTGRPLVLRLMGAGITRPSHPIPGTDMAGVIEAVGSSVTAFREGEEVFGETMPGHQWTHGGAYAEYVAVREEWLAPKPANVTFAQAASVPSSGFIALTNLRDVDRLGVGKKVLINGAAGGVGSLALQIVKAHGAHVTAVDHTDKLGLLHTLGADEVIDYSREDFTLGGVQYDLVFDIPGNHPFSACRRALKPDGRYVPIGHEGFGERGNRLVGIFPYFVSLMLRARFVEQLKGPGIPLPDRRQTLAALTKLLEAGHLTPVIDRTYALADVHAAFSRLTGGEAVGKVIIAP